MQRTLLAFRTAIAGAAALFTAAVLPQEVLAQDTTAHEATTAQEPTTAQEQPANETPASEAKTPDTKTPDTKGNGGIVVELNKLEPSDKGCRLYVVVSNPTDTSYDAYKLDIVMFQPDGIIGRRFYVDLAPLRPSKRTVKPFELDGTQCDGVGSFLINDVMECRASSGPVDDCLANMKVNSLTKVEISK